MEVSVFEGFGAGNKSEEFQDSLFSNLQYLLNLNLIDKSSQPVQWKLRLNMADNFHQLHFSAFLSNHKDKAKSNFVYCLQEDDVNPNSLTGIVMIGMQLAVTVTETKLAEDQIRVFSLYQHRASRHKIGDSLIDNTSEKRRDVN